METFVPLYISNICDSACKMCNLNRYNTKISRKEAPLEQVRTQLEIIKNREKVSAVCILTGERLLEVDRQHNLKRVISAMKAGFELGFEKIFFNIGALTSNEIKSIYHSFNTYERSKIVLSLFQETYNKEVFSRFFACSNVGHKSDFSARLLTPNIWIAQGFRSVDIGILLGFMHHFEDDVDSLIEHANSLISEGIEVFVSTPRIKDGLCSDADYLMIIQKIRNSLPKAKLIITTREKIDFINSVIESIDVVSPGSSDVCPYSEDNEYLPNLESTSQFVLEEKRLRPSVVLNQLKCDRIKYFAK